jgi:hypothetical protein
MVISDNIVEVKGNYCLVSTISLSEDHDGYLYETFVFPADASGEVSDYGELHRERYVSMSEAETGHDEVVRKIRSGELNIAKRG